MAELTMDSPVSTTEPERPAEVPEGLQLRDEDVARRAHEIYLQRGGGDGHDHDDWFRAEAELRAERAAQAGAGQPLLP